MNINKAMLFGNLTRDPEMKALPSGTNVTEFSIATNRRYKDRDGNWQDAVDYHNIVVFGRQAETTSQYLAKGSSAFIEGRLQTRSWEKDGQKQYRTEVIADRVQFGPKGSNGGVRQQIMRVRAVAPTRMSNRRHRSIRMRRLTLRTSRFKLQYTQSALLRYGNLVAHGSHLPLVPNSLRRRAS